MVENRAKDPEGEKMIKGFSFLKGGGTIIRVTERRSKRATQSRGAGSFNPEELIVSQQNTLITNF